MGLIKCPWQQNDLNIEKVIFIMYFKMPVRQLFPPTSPPLLRGQCGS